MKKKRKERILIKYKIWEIVKYGKVKLWVFDKILEKDNNIILENK